MSVGHVLEDLHLLVILAQTKSFTQSAVRLGLSKATVSTRIAELEKKVGVPLVRRTTRSVGLTDAGLRFVAETQSAFERIEQSFSGIRDLADAPRGLLRVTAPVALGRQWLASAMPRFMSSYPEVRIELDLSDRIVRLAHEGFDLALRHTSAPPDTHVAWTLHRSQTWLVASPEYVRRHGQPLQPTDLAAHNCLSYLRETGSSTWTFEQTATRKRSAERQVASINGSFKANNSEVLREAAIGGAGIALLPDFSAAQALADGSLIHLLPAWQSVGFFGEHIYAIRPFAAQVPQAVQVFVDFLRSVFAQGLPQSGHTILSA
ncbi:MAG: LysR substrate-binding domain-containing protein [Aquabacterium sp.]|nr:LysR substrate-binding domain-containing protein [Aquabacterium sp.]